ncbi:MAG: RNA polymerase sigma factor [Bacteroidota bacterium]
MVTDIQLRGITDDQLIKGCIEGRAAYQQLLYKVFSSKMFGVCLRYAGDFHSAEDILQEGFIKVFNKLDYYRGEGSFEGWMRRIFINTAIEYYRKSARQYRCEELKFPDDHSLSGNALQNLMRDDLLKVIQQLPDGYRTVFNLYAIEGYNHKEIGKMLDISEGTSKSQLARARIYLKKLIQAI